MQNFQNKSLETLKNEKSDGDILVVNKSAMNEIAVCFGCDNNYVQHLAAVISSILKSKNDNEFIKIYVIDGKISEANKKKLKFFENNYDCCITYVKPNLKDLKNCNTYKGDYISKAAYYRLFIPELIPQEDKILYLDCDIIVRKSLWELFNKQFGDNVILGVVDVSEKEHSKRLKTKQYINTGVLLFNSKVLRERNSEEQIIDWITHNQKRIECHDQDVVNAVFNGRIKYLEHEYNTQVKKEHDTIFCDIKDPAILHFISPKKPWCYWKPLNTTHWASEYFSALEGTPWENFVKTYKRNEKLIYPLRYLYPKGISRKIIRFIFSIKNSADRRHKVVTILGINIYFNKKKIINR